MWFAAKQNGTMQQEISRAAINQRAEEILNTYGNSILRYAYTYLHNMSDAEEVLQDTLVQFLKTAPVFESREHEKAWLLRVAGNLSKNRLAYNSLRRTDELNDELVAENREDLSFVWDAVKLLPENYREAIHLFYYEGYSTKQIAKLLGKKEATVRSDLRRGRERLKAVLKEAYDFEEAV
nr:sigma-70 family RNA polymerase sigma factor [Colidextribacter sp. OB.20]